MDTEKCNIRETRYGLRDIPVSSLAEEILGLTPYVESLSEFVAKCETPMTIAIQGDWGSGKTSMMNLVRLSLPKNMESVWFNTWQFSQFAMHEQLCVSFLTSLIKKISPPKARILKKKAISIVKQLGWQAIKTGIKVHHQP